MKTSRYPLIGGMALALAVAAEAAIEPPDWQQVLKELRELREEQKSLRQTVAGQQKTIETLQRQIAASDEKQKLAAEAAAALAPAPGAMPATPGAPGAQADTAAKALAAPGGSPFRIGGGRSYMDISLDVLAAAAWTSKPDSETRNLQFGGHDPHERGFTLQNAELALQGIVDPYFRGDAFIIMQIDRGETIVELEEAYLTTLQMPWNLQLKGGQFFTEFGRLGSSMPHPHTWSFADQPVIWGRMFGPDGLRNPGARVSWLAPTPFYLELFGAAQNAEGGTASSFLNSPGETFAGRTLTGRSVRNWSDLLYTTRAAASFDLDDENTLSLGASAAFGPNSTGGDTRTVIYGGDIYWKWKPVQNDHGWPFLKWTTEALGRSYDAAAQWDPATGVPLFRDETLHDWGLYSEIAWGFERPWIAAVRADYANGGAGHDPLRDRRVRLSPNITYFFSEFSKLRLQYNADWAAHLNDNLAHAVFLQFEYLMGAHGAHKF
ncbi:MAG: hypothetical protein HZA91_11330 [Verrucomicrobia bacterium]|nr:hypothetical protein [Verrucomicrobiota bacterium]